MRRRPLILVSVVAVAGSCSSRPGAAGRRLSASREPRHERRRHRRLRARRRAAPAGAARQAGAGGRRRPVPVGMNVGTKDGPKFSACMRKHGITNFPDPSSTGVISIHSGMGIDPSSPTFQSARTACAKLLPNGGQPTPAQIAQRQQQMLTFAKCMRAHGIKDFPDPSGGGLRLTVHPGSDLSPDNPTFQKANEACAKDMPFKGGVSTGSGAFKAGG